MSYYINMGQISTNWIWYELKEIKIIDNNKGTVWAKRINENSGMKTNSINKKKSTSSKRSGDRMPMWFKIWNETVFEPFRTRVEATLERHERILNEHTEILKRHELILERHERILNEHSDIFKRNNLH
jgi:hypothetical protein